MTYPNEFRTQEKVVGDSVIKHPIYTFSVNLSRMFNEKFGPNTNQADVNLLHPDMCVSSPDYGRSLLSAHDGVAKHTWLPGFLTGENIDINDDGTITAYGMKAVYLKKTYADVANPILTLINDPPYTSA